MTKLLMYKYRTDAKIAKIDCSSIGIKVALIAEQDSSVKYDDQYYICCINQEEDGESQGSSHRKNAILIKQGECVFEAEKEFKEVILAGYQNGKKHLIEFDLIEGSFKITRITLK